MSYKLLQKYFRDHSTIYFDNNGKVVLPNTSTNKTELKSKYHKLKDMYDKVLSKEITDSTEVNKIIKDIIALYSEITGKEHPSAIEILASLGE